MDAIVFQLGLRITWHALATLDHSYPHLEKVGSLVYISAAFPELTFKLYFDPK